MKPQAKLTPVEGQTVYLLMAMVSFDNMEESQRWANTLCSISNLSASELSCCLTVSVVLTPLALPTLLF